jgi:hypothetical protein
MRIVNNSAQLQKVVVHAKINAGERKRMNKPSREQREKTNEID